MREFLKKFKKFLTPKELKEAYAKLERLEKDLANLENSLKEENLTQEK